MTAILKELRLLEAEHARGRITDTDLVRRKAALMRDIPEAFEVANADIEPKPPSGSPWDMLALLLIAAALCGSAVLLVVGDIFMAMTFGITVLAALTIKLFLSIED